MKGVIIMCHPSRRHALIAAKALGTAQAGLAQLTHACQWRYAACQGPHVFVVQAIKRLRSLRRPFVGTPQDVGVFKHLFAQVCQCLGPTQRDQ
jgi:hypothetical protein